MTQIQKMVTGIRQDKKLLALFTGAIFDVVLMLSLAVTAVVWYL